MTGSARSPSRLPIVPFDRKAHDRSHFLSGEPDLDDWLRRLAGQATRQDSARTYVACDGIRVVGYYSLCAFQLERGHAPARTRAGAHPIPAVLLARLAVDQSAQGEGLGAYLLLDALRISALVADRIGARVMVVHAAHERAAEFYLHHGFARFDTEPLTLYLLMQDVRATLGVLTHR
jgi:GNAT superfamily N-acetyltransferase